MKAWILAAAWSACFCTAATRPQDLDAVLAKADALLEDAKKAYEDGRDRSAVEAFVDASFKLEEARIKYLVLQEIGEADRQKTASERLRTVQQLSKLINDGKAAVLQSRSSPPLRPEGSSSPAPSPRATVRPASPAVRPNSDATRRLPVPDAAAVKESEKLLRELYKEEFAKKGAAESRALARLFLEQAEKSSDDPAGLYATYRAALDAAVAGSDLETALYSADEIARVFDVDGLELRSTTLALAAKTARTPEDWSLLADAQLRLAQECVFSDLYGPAEKEVSAALQSARKAKNASLSQIAVLRSKEIGEAKSSFAGMKRHLETLANTPDHPGANQEMGQFLCYVKGNWDLGLRFMAKGADAKLKALAEREIAIPERPEDLVELAESWEALAGKERSSLRKNQMMAHARDLYRTALPEAAGLLRVKIEKRLEADRPSTLASPPKGAPGVDLLALIDPAKDTLVGGWRREGKVVIGGTGERARMLIPYHPPDEYDLIVVAERIAGGATLGFGLSRGDRQWTVLFDTFANGHQSGLDTLDGKPAWANETSIKERLVHVGKEMTYEFRVRQTGIAVLLDGKTVIDWKGDYSRLTVNPRWEVPDRKALFLCAFGAEMKYNKITLVAVTGYGRKLR